MGCCDDHENGGQARGSGVGGGGAGLAVGQPLAVHRNPLTGRVGHVPDVISPHHVLALPSRHLRGEHLVP